MIKLTRLDGRQFYLNCDLIEFFEAMPDTIITLRTEKKILVKESVDDVLNKIVTYKQSISSTPFYQKGAKFIVNSDTPDLFLFDKNMKNLKTMNDIKDIEYDEDGEEYEED